MARARDISSGALPAGPGKGRDPPPRAHSTSPAASSLVVRAARRPLRSARPPAQCDPARLNSRARNPCRIRPHEHPRQPRQRGDNLLQRPWQRRCRHPHCASAPLRAAARSSLLRLDSHRPRQLPTPNGHQLRPRPTAWAVSGPRTAGSGRSAAPPSLGPTVHTGLGRARLFTRASSATAALRHRCQCPWSSGAASLPWHRRNAASPLPHRASRAPASSRTALSRQR